MSPIWWLIILLIVAILLFFFFRGRLARPVAAGTSGNASNNIGISNVSLAVAPASVPCDGATKFVCTVTANGWSADGIARNVGIDFYDDEAFPDHLDHDPKPGAGAIGITIGQQNPGGLWNWTLTHTNSSLYCDTACHVVGPEGSSGESDPRVYVKLTIAHDTQPWKESSRVQLECASD